MVKQINLSESSGQSFKQATPGYQTARLLRIIDTGIHRQEYKGEVKNPKTVLQFIFELSEDTVVFKGEEKPMVAFARATLSGGGPKESTLEKILKALGADPKNVDLESLIGKPIGLVIDEKGFISAFSALTEKKAAMVPKVVADSFFFDYDDPKADIIKKLGKKTIEKLKEAVNYSNSRVEALLDGETATETTGDEVV